MTLKNINNWLIHRMPYILLFISSFFIGCTKQELIDLPNGNVVGSILFDDTKYGYCDYPGGLIQIKAQCGSTTYWTSPDEKGQFRFSNLPAGDADFTLFENNEELVSVENCSFLGGEVPSQLNFDLLVQPDLKSIDFHFETTNDSIWMIGKVELDGAPSLKLNKVILFMNFPPMTFYSGDPIDFDWETGIIKCRMFKIYNSDTGSPIYSFVYKKYREYSATFNNHVLHFPQYYRNMYDESYSAKIVKCDSTSIYSFIIP